jgi:hypothetical protein
MLGDLFGGGGGGIDIDEAIRTNARVNRVNQYTPFANLTFSGPEKTRMNFNLSPEMQDIFDEQTAFGAESVGLGRGMLSAIPETGDDAVAAIMGRLNPQLQMREDQLRSRLENSGNPAAFGGDLAEGSFNELSLFNQGANDARLAAILAGPQYQGSMINNALTLGAGSPVSVPQFQFQGATPIDTNSLFMQDAQMQNDRQMGMLGGLADLGSAAMLGGFF